MENFTLFFTIVILVLCSSNGGLTMSSGQVRKPNVNHKGPWGLPMFDNNRNNKMAEFEPSGTKPPSLLSDELPRNNTGSKPREPEAEVVSVPKAKNTTTVGKPLGKVKRRRTTTVRTTTPPPEEFDYYDYYGDDPGAEPALKIVTTTALPQYGCPKDYMSCRNSCQKNGFFSGFCDGTYCRCYGSSN